MKCLCCGKEISDKASVQEKNTQWHFSCVRRFFGTGSLPELDISEDTLTRIAVESTNKGFTVPGVQKKMSLHLTADGGKPRLTLVNYPTGFILKPQTEQFEALPEAEYMVMQMARKTGIATVPYALIQMSGSGTVCAYITKRIDRILPTKKEPTLKMLAMEDFCQLEQRLTEKLSRYKLVLEGWSGNNWNVTQDCSLVICGESIEQNRRISEIAAEVGIHVLFTEDILLCGKNFYKSIYDLEDPDTPAYYEYTTA